MPSDRRPPRTPRQHTVRERRAIIACTRCRRLRKKCKQECGTSSPHGKCERCCATGEICKYLNVIDDISPHVPSPPPTDLCMEELKSAKNGPVLQLQWRYANLTSDTGQQQLVHQSSPSSGSSTHETENISNNSHNTRQDDIRYLSNWVNQVADPSLSPLYASRSATESAQYDQRSSYPSHTTFDVDAQRPGSMSFHDYHDLNLYYEGPRSQSNILIGMASTYYEEANTYASSDGQVFSATNDLKCLVCLAINCENHPNCGC